MKEFRKIISHENLKNIFKKNKLRNNIQKLVTLQATTKEIAFSIALGIFIGLLIPMGLQTVFIIPLAAATGSNIALAYTATLISNPFTIIPIYYSALQIGSYLTKINFTWNDFNIVIINPTYGNIIKLGSEGLAVFFTGALLQAILFSAFFYIISFKSIEYLRKRKNKFLK